MAEQINPPRDQNIEDFNVFAEEFGGETDRAAVVLGAAKLDTLLYHLIQKSLLPNTSSNDELLDGDAPISTFSSRINMAFRLGLIDPELTRALHLVKRIRNIFAHELSKSSLNSGVHKDRIDELVGPLAKHEGFKFLTKKFFKDSHDAATLFRSAVAFICLRLMGACERAVRLTNKNVTSLLYEMPKSKDAT